MGVGSRRLLILWRHFDGSNAILNFNRRFLVNSDSQFDLTDRDQVALHEDHLLKGLLIFDTRLRFYNTHLFSCHQNNIQLQYVQSRKITLGSLATGFCN